MSGLFKIGLAKSDNLAKRVGLVKGIGLIKQFLVNLIVTKTGNGTITPDVGIYPTEPGTEITATATATDPDYNFKEWDFEGTLITTNPYIFTVNGAMSYIGKFEGTIPYLYSQNLISLIENDPTGATPLNATDKNAIKILFRELWAINNDQENFFRPDNPALSVANPIYPHLGDTPNSKKWNMVDARDLDAAYRIVWDVVEDWVFALDKAQPNGLTTEGNTKFLPNNLNEGHLLWFTNNWYKQENKIDIGDPNLASLYFGSNYTSSKMIYRYMGVTYYSATPAPAYSDTTPTHGLWMMNRFNNGLFKLYTYATEIISHENVASIYPTNPIRIAGKSATWGSTKNTQFASMGNASISDVARPLYVRAIINYLANRNQYPMVTSIGDSISLGAKATNRETQSYASVFAAAISKIPIWYGQSGNTIAQVTTMYNSKKERIHPNSIILLQDGTNDVTIDATWYGLYTDLIELLITDGYLASNIYLISPPYQEAKIAKNATIASYLDQAALEYGVKAVHCTVYMQNNGGNTLMDVDKIHPNTAGHAVMGQLILDKYNE